MMGFTPLSLCSTHPIALVKKDISLAMEMGPLSGYGAPVTSLLLGDLAESAPNPTYGRIFAIA
jgi:hypothetical protein